MEIHFIVCLLGFVSGVLTGYAYRRKEDEEQIDHLEWELHLAELKLAALEKMLDVKKGESK